MLPSVQSVPRRLVWIIRPGLRGTDFGSSRGKGWGEGEERVEGEEGVRRGSVETKMRRIWVSSSLTAD